MQCSNCGAEIPFAGKVCPLCKADKSKDQFATILSVPLGLGGAALGGYTLGAWGGVAGFIAGVVAALMLGAKVAEANKRGPKQ